MAIQTCMTFSSVEHFFLTIKVSWVQNNRSRTPLTFIVWTKTFYKMSFVFSQKKQSHTGLGGHDGG